MKNKYPVEKIPNIAKVRSNFFFEFPASANAPNTGALMAINNPTKELAEPITNVLSASDKSLAQYDLKKIGKNPAMTVVAKAEFAQS